eukprot:13051717-Alexandrium_andersonii.AAC.1
MSASLVGSEMCIRDRNSPGGSQLANCCGHPCLVVNVVEKVCVNEFGTACLLYTSDAADDM